MDSKTNINELKEKIKKFCEERDWDQYHNAKDLAIGIITESSELLEHFRFKSEKQVEELFNSPGKKEKISEEILSLPMYPELGIEELYYICDCIREFDESRMSTPVER